jgi:hypothetical protein
VTTVGEVLIPSRPLHKVCAFLSDHHARQAGVHSYHRGKNARVGDPKPTHAAHTQLWINHSEGIVGRSHSASSRRMVHGIVSPAHIFAEIVIFLDNEAWRELVLNPGTQGRLLGNPSSYFQSC